MVKVLKLKPEDLHCIRTAHQTISSNPAKQFTIRDISMAVGINRNKLQSGFKVLYQMTFHECQVQLKIQQAESLLLTTDKVLKEIVALTGFKDKSSLIKAFKRIHGMTPIEWKEKQLGDNVVYNGLEPLLSAV